jgi:hypothetical protein
MKNMGLVLIAVVLLLGWLAGYAVSDQEEMPELTVLEAAVDELTLARARRHCKYLCNLSGLSGRIAGCRCTLALFTAKRYVSTSLAAVFPKVGLTHGLQVTWTKRVLLHKH